MNQEATVSLAFAGFIGAVLMAMPLVAERPYPTLTEGGQLAGSATLTAFNAERAAIEVLPAKSTRPTKLDVKLTDPKSGSVQELSYTIPALWREAENPALADRFRNSGDRPTE